MCIFREGFFWVDMEARLLERFHGFFRILLASPSHEVAVVAVWAARDIRSTLVSYLTQLRNKTGLLTLGLWGNATVAQSQGDPTEVNISPKMNIE